MTLLQRWNGYLVFIFLSLYVLSFIFIVFFYLDGSALKHGNEQWQLVVCSGCDCSYMQWLTGVVPWAAKVVMDVWRHLEGTVPP